MRRLIPGRQRRTDIGDRGTMDPVQREFFGSARPASTLVPVRALAVPEARVEIDAVARVPERT